MRGTQGLCRKKAALMASGPREPGVWEPYKPEKESVVWAVGDWCSLPARGSGPPLPPDTVFRAQGHPASDSTLATSLFWPWTHYAGLSPQHPWVLCLVTCFPQLENGPSTTHTPMSPLGILSIAQTPTHLLRVPKMTEQAPHPESPHDNLSICGPLIFFFFLEDHELVTQRGLGTFAGCGGCPEWLIGRRCWSRGQCQDGQRGWGQ